ncbi:unnamed protein product [Prorocentrum cordatum]|uniref:FACT complex subunit n=1 Tax=Prorocentrum cordatum TaxID=2364126 RepID=A0ABN9TYM2_9DINO|nr:unnamed protein product [Polarella glacialis]
MVAATETMSHDITREAGRVICCVVLELKPDVKLAQTLAMSSLARAIWQSDVHLAEAAFAAHFDNGPEFATILKDALTLGCHAECSNLLDDIAAAGAAAETDRLETDAAGRHNIGVGQLLRVNSCVVRSKARLHWSIAMKRVSVALSPPGILGGDLLDQRPADQGRDLAKVCALHFKAQPTDQARAAEFLTEWAAPLDWEARANQAGWPACSLSLAVGSLAPISGSQARGGRPERGTAQPGGTELGKYTVEVPSQREVKKVKVKLALSLHGTIVVQSAQMVEDEKDSEEPIPGIEPAAGAETGEPERPAADKVAEVGGDVPMPAVPSEDGSPLAGELKRESSSTLSDLLGGGGPLKKRKKVHRTELTVVPSPSCPGLPEDKVKERTESEEKMRLDMAEIEETNNKRNELESYILTMRSSIAEGQKYGAYITAQETATSL